MIVVANKKNKLRSAALQLLTIGLALVGLSLAYWFFTPVFYQATAKVEIGTVEREVAKARDEIKSAALLAEFRYLGSDEYLDPVIASLHLAERWANPSVAPLTPEEARGAFRAKAHIEVIPHSKVFAFQVTSRDPAETAEIANLLANRFREHRQAQAPVVQNDAEKLAEKFKPKWDAATRKIIEAQDRVTELAAAITRSLTSNGITVYDDHTLESMRAQRVRLESEFTAARATQDRLRAISAAQLRQVLPTLITNNLLDQTLDLLNHAQNELRDAQTRFPAEAPEVRVATTNVALLEAGVDQVIRGILDARDVEVSARKATLDDLIAKLAQAHANTGVGLPARNPEYLAALRILDEARYEREQLTNDLAQSAVLAIHPAPLAAEIVSAASFPRQPSSPNPKAALAVAITGGFLTFIGILMWTAPSGPAAGSKVKGIRLPDRGRMNFPGRN